MCAISNTGDSWTKRWDQPTYPQINPLPPLDWKWPDVSREEFDTLKKDVEKMKEELKKAKQQDIDDNNPDCEMEDKVELLKKIAELVGVDLTEIFG